MESKSVIVERIFNRLRGGGARLLLLLSSIWIFLLFASWNFQQYLYVGFSFSGLVSGDYLELSNHANWLQLGAEVARGNLFPIDTSLGQGDTGFRFFPYLTLWIYGLMIAVFGISGATLIGSTVLPVFSFVFMVLIYRHYLPWRWSIALSSLGILGFNSAPFRDFLLDLVSGTGWRELGVSNLPDAMRFPFPAISLLVFLTVFYLTIRRAYMSKRRATFLSIAWALQSQIHIFNAVFGLPFWFCFLVLNIWRHNKGRWSAQQTLQMLQQVFIVLVVFIPSGIAIMMEGSLLDSWQFLLGSDTAYSASFDWFFVGAYIVLPLVMLYVAYRVFRVDPYELAFKFLPVWVAMVVELALTLAWHLFNMGIPSDLLFVRLGIFFLHIFYFTPTVYCLCRPNMHYNLGTEGNAVASKIRSAISWIFRDASFVYLPLFVVLLTGFALASSGKALEHFQKSAKHTNIENSMALDLLLQDVKIGDVLVGPNNSINLSIPVIGRYGSLWVNRFVNTIGVESAIERFATYAKIVGWTEKQFLSFMLPGVQPIYRSVEVFDFTSSGVIPGLGYWMVFHRTPLDVEGMRTLSSRLKTVYASLDVENKLKEYGVRKILVHGDLQFVVNVPIRKEGDYSIVDFQR